MNKKELIEKLNNMPNLPVVMELDCDTYRSKEVESVEIKKVVKREKFDYHMQEYSDSEYDLERYPNDIIEVIWIS